MVLETGLLNIFLWMPIPNILLCSLYPALNRHRDMFLYLRLQSGGRPSRGSCSYSQWAHRDNGLFHIIAKRGHVEVFLNDEVAIWEYIDFVEEHIHLTICTFLLYTQHTIQCWLNATDYWLMLHNGLLSVLCGNVAIC